MPMQNTVIHETGPSTNPKAFMSHPLICLYHNCGVQEPKKSLYSTSHHIQPCRLIVGYALKELTLRCRSLVVPPKPLHTCVVLSTRNKFGPPFVHECRCGRHRFARGMALWLVMCLLPHVVFVEHHASMHNTGSIASKGASNGDAQVHVGHCLQDNRERAQVQLLINVSSR